MRNGVFFLFSGLATSIICSSLFAFSFLDTVGLCISAIAACALLTTFKNRSSVAVILILISSFCFGLVRISLSQSSSGAGELDSLLGKTVSIQGLIVAEPDKRDSQVLLTVFVESINQTVLEHPIKVLLFAKLGPTYHYGDRIQIEGKLKPIKNFLTDTGQTFDYIHYLSRSGIYYSLSNPDIQVLAEHQGNQLLQTLFALKAAFVSRVERVIPYPASALLGGLLLGAKRSLNQNLLDAFTKTGVIHMVVISGYNITIVGNVIASCLSFLPRLVALGGSVFGILLFVGMTGFSGASVRAALMALTAIAAKFFRRNYDPVRALFLSGFLMIAYNPDTLLHDPSFQLSFIGTLGIMTVPKYIEPRFWWITERFGLREMIVSCVASEISLLPLLLYMTGMFSVVALPTNLLVLFPVPLTMLFGFLTGAAGFIHFYASVPFGFMAFLLLTYELNMTTWLSKFPFASIQFPFSLGEMIFMYVLYVLVIVFYEYKIDKRKSPDPVAGD